WEGHNLNPVRPDSKITSLAYPEYVAKLLANCPDKSISELALRSGSESRGDIFSAPCETAETNSAILSDPGQPSRLFDDYGLALLRSGKGEDARALTLIYDGPQIGHRHFDRMSIGLFAKGLDLMPELPYPKSWSMEHIHNFEGNSLLHNTVTFDRSPSRFEQGRLDFYHSVPGLQVIAARSTNGDGSRQVERICALVDVDDTNAYVVDFVRAHGGSEQHYSLHGPAAKKVTVDGVEMQAQAGGTLAGADVEYGRRLTASDGSTALHPFCFFKNVERGTAEREYAVDYDLGD